MKPYEKTIKVTDIHLDQQNPRFPTVNSQREAIESMLKDQGEKIATLALDIYLNGLNPSVKLILFKEAGRFVDGDGNRRLTALKILETPALADAFPRVRKKFDSILKQSGSVPKEVGCVIFSDRTAARHWISVNHGGEQEGRGQITWNAEQKDRFESKPSIGLEALDFLTHTGLITSEDKSQVNKSTLDRLLSYKDVKSVLSITKNGAHFTFGNTEYLQKTVLNLKGTAVDDVYTAAKGIAFVHDSITSTFTASNEPNDNAAGTTGKSEDAEKAQAGRSRRVKNAALTIFGGKLTLRKGHVNNLYRDIESLHNFYQKDKRLLSSDFIVIIRMSLRMLAETAAKDQNISLGKYFAQYFDSAKRTLDQNIKTTLSIHNINNNSITKLFHSGAHDYHSSKNEEQALALSIILGAMLTLSHGKQP